MTYYDGVSKSLKPEKVQTFYSSIPPRNGGTVNGQMGQHRCKGGLTWDPIKS